MMGDTLEDHFHPFYFINWWIAWFLMQLALFCVCGGIAAYRYLWLGQFGKPLPPLAHAYMMLQSRCIKLHITRACLMYDMASLATVHKCRWRVKPLAIWSGCFEQVQIMHKSAHCLRFVSCTSLRWCKEKMRQLDALCWCSGWFCFPLTNITTSTPHT